MESYSDCYAGSKLTVKVEIDNEIYVPEFFWYILMRNVLDNANKYNKNKNPEVIIRCNKYEKGFEVLCISNWGLEGSEEDRRDFNKKICREKIRHKYNKTKGHGIALYTLRKLGKKLGYDISAEGNEDSFTVKIKCKYECDDYNDGQDFWKEIEIIMRHDFNNVFNSLNYLPLLEQKTYKGKKKIEKLKKTYENLTNEIKTTSGGELLKLMKKYYPDINDCFNELQKTLGDSEVGDEKIKEYLHNISAGLEKFNEYYSIYEKIYNKNKERVNLKTLIETLTKQSHFNKSITNH